MECPDCEGAGGWLDSVEDGWGGEREEWETCRRCGGDGVVEGERELSPAELADAREEAAMDDGHGEASPWD